MPNLQGKLKLDLVDISGRRLAEKVDLFLYRQGPGTPVKVRQVDASRSVQVTGLNPPPQSIYRLFVDPPSYLPVQQFVHTGTGAVDPVTIRFPIDSTKVVRVDFPRLNRLSSEVRALIAMSGADYYESLDDVRRAGLLNVVTKAERTLLPDGRTVLSYFESIEKTQGDRLLVRVPANLIDETREGVLHGLFEPAPDLLHEPPSGYARATSYKSPDHYGNLQLTFFTNGADWKADVDIDDANGFAHIFQVARNALKSRTTHPYDIHQILLGYQGLDPQYRLIVTA